MGNRIIVEYKRYIPTEILSVLKKSLTPLDILYQMEDKEHFHYAEGQFEPIATFLIQSAIGGMIGNLFTEALKLLYKNLVHPKVKSSAIDHPAIEIQIRNERTNVVLRVEGIISDKDIDLCFNKFNEMFESGKFQNNEGIRNSYPINYTYNVHSGLWLPNENRKGGKETRRY